MTATRRVFDAQDVVIASAVALLAQLGFVAVFSLPSPKLVQADISQHLDRIPDLSGEPRKAALAQADRALEEADELVRINIPCPICTSQSINRPLILSSSARPNEA